jgi:hypothetical protein
MGRFMVGGWFLSCRRDLRWAATSRSLAKIIGTGRATVNALFFGQRGIYGIFIWSALGQKQTCAVH